MQASYTWSKAEGDGEDFAQQLGDDRSLLEDEKGFQSYDQRHVVKVNATTITPWGFRLGAAVSWGIRPALLLAPGSSWPSTRSRRSSATSERVALPACWQQYINRPP